MSRQVTTKILSRVTLITLAFTTATAAAAFTQPPALTTRVASRTTTASTNDGNIGKSFRYSRSGVPLRAGIAREICTFEADDYPSPTFPYGKTEMARLDESDDEDFYAAPRFVTHIDDYAIDSLKDFYQTEFQTLLAGSTDKNKKLNVLDLCSSWISHLPTDNIPYGRVTGVGMNDEELRANPQLTDHICQNLNKNPLLTSLEDASYDVVCNVVSVDYLTDPLAVFTEMHRLLRPGGIALISFSNRCFATKAVNIWLRSDDIGRLSIVGSYFHYAEGEWSEIVALDIKKRLKVPEKPGNMEMFRNPSLGYAWMSTVSEVNKVNGGDPMFVVKGTKK